MALSDSTRVFHTQLKDFSGIEKDFRAHFELNGYTVASEVMSTGLFLSITKGGIFQSVVGLKTALNINLKCMDDSIVASTEVGAFGKQILPSAITLFVAWPVVIPQILGLIRQSKLDEEAYHVIEQAIQKYENTSIAQGGQFCTGCGGQLVEDAVFCPKCGKKVSEECVCIACGAKLAAGSAFCIKCGAKQE